MRSFLKEIEDKFLDLEESCDKCDTPKSQCACDEEIDEQNVTAAVAGYNTPGAFRKTVKKVDYGSGVEIKESVKKIVKVIFKNNINNNNYFNFSITKK